MSLVKEANMSKSESGLGLAKAQKSLQRRANTPGGTSNKQLKGLAKGVAKNIADPDHPGKTASLVKAAGVIDREESGRQVRTVLNRMTRRLTEKDPDERKRLKKNPITPVKIITEGNSDDDGNPRLFQWSMKVQGPKKVSLTLDGALAARKL